MLVNLILKGKTTDLFEHIFCRLVSDYFFFCIKIVPLVSVDSQMLYIELVKPNTPNSLLL